MSSSTHRESGVSRTRLLASVSSIALVTAVMASGSAFAQEPTVWLEAGWHSEQVYDSGNGFALPLDALIPQSGITGPLTDTLNLSRSQGDDGKITFRPDGTDWVFSASLQYGRARGKGHVHQNQHLPTSSFATFHTTIPTYPFPYHRTSAKPVHETARFVDADTTSTETHYILDFEAGKDVGLGMFGSGSTSTFGVGVRFAHFTNALNARFYARPDAHITYTQMVRPTNAFFPSSTRVVPWYFTRGRQRWHDLAGNPQSEHSFTGIGPSISWEASAPLWGSSERDSLSVDWTVNAGVLFGKQKNKIQHQTMITSECFGAGSFAGSQYVQCAAGSPYKNASSTHTSKNVTVPNLGGSIGLSYRLHDVKLNVGYRADYFFGVLNTGFAGAQSVTRGFQGPYASVSIGMP